MFAVLLAAVAVTVPVGFIENATLDARASYVAAKPVQVYCAANDAAWQAYIVASGAVPPGGIANGLTIVGGGETYLSPATCAPILTRLARRTPSLLALGATLQVLTHESEHMRGTTDEGQAECVAIRTLPAYLVSQWGFKKNSPAFLRVIRGAWNYHRAQPSSYRTVC